MPKKKGNRINPNLPDHLTVRRDDKAIADIMFVQMDTRVLSSTGKGAVDQGEGDYIEAALNWISKMTGG
jgi:hypothetical protein